MGTIVKGRVQFNTEALKGADLDKLIEDHKHVSPEIVQEAWEEVNGKIPKKKSSKESKI